MGEKNETLGRRIARLRLEHGMTQERLARELGVTAQAVSKWENDLSAPDIMSLPRLARTLGVTVDELLGAEAAEAAAEPEPAVEPEPEALPEPAPEEPPAKARRLHIQVHDANDGDDVNINVPLGMASVMLRGCRFLPGEAGRDLREAGVSLDALADAIKHGECGTLVEVDGGDGDRVTISLE